MKTRNVRLPYKDRDIDDPAPAGNAERLTLARKVVEWCDGDPDRTTRWLRRASFSPEEIQATLEQDKEDHLNRIK